MELLSLLVRFMHIHSALDATAIGARSRGVDPQWDAVADMDSLASEGTRIAQVLADAPRVPDAVVEEYLPQLCLLLAAPCASGHAARQLADLQQAVLARVAATPLLGLRLCWLLEDTVQSPGVHPLRRAQALRMLQAAQLSLCTGQPSDAAASPLPDAVQETRARYFTDCQAFVRSLVRISESLRAVPRRLRDIELHARLRLMNQRLASRMASEGRQFGEDGAPLPEVAGFVSDAELARHPQFPLLAAHALHFPLGKSTDAARRILRIVPDECVTLPSRSRAPFLLTVEVLDTPYHCGDAGTYAEGAPRGLSVYDVLRGRSAAAAGAAGVAAAAAALPAPDDADADADVPAAAAPVAQQARGGSGPAAAARGAAAAARADERSPLDDVDPSNVSTEVVAQVASVFGELWHWKEKRLRSTSEFGNLPGWRLASMIVKSGDNLKGEQLGMQMIALFDNVFKEEGLDLWLATYSILTVGKQAGLIENVVDSSSIDTIKKRSYPRYTTLRAFYERMYGGLLPQRTFYEAEQRFRGAQANFARSLAAYSLVTYFLQVKDRHNANILIDKAGHIIHIDYGYILGERPNSEMLQSWALGQAPFKLTDEYVDLLDGPNSATFRQFEELFVAGFVAIRKHAGRVLCLLETFASTPAQKAALSAAMQQRLGGPSPPGGAEYFARCLVAESLGNSLTKAYDLYQQRFIGIAA